MELIIDGDKIRKGAVDAIKDYIIKSGGVYSQECNEVVVKISNQGGTPLVVTKNIQYWGNTPKRYN